MNQSSGIKTVKIPPTYDYAMCFIKRKRNASYMNAAINENLLCAERYPIQRKDYESIDPRHCIGRILEVHVEDMEIVIDITYPILRSVLEDDLVAIPRMKYKIINNAVTGRFITFDIAYKTDFLQER